MLSVQHEDFNVGEEYALISLRASNPGGVAMFVGLVRDVSGGLSQMFLEHYPEMTEKAIENIILDAKRRWTLQSVRVIHRVGDLRPNDQIVFVGVASTHRAVAFSAAEFIMDQLKSRAPFWKKEKLSNGERWVQAKSSDEKALARWL